MRTRPPIVLASLAGGALAAAVACSGATVISTELAEKAITYGLTEKGLELASVTCPGGKAARAGETFTCTATTKAGDPALVDVTVLDEQGHTTWELRGVVIHEKLMGDGISEQSHGAIKVRCPDKVVVIAVGASFTCEAGSGGQAGHIAITITDKAGNETWKLVP